jgi:hypothetical protein
MQKFVRGWIPHDLSKANRRERALKANLLLEELRADEGNEFANKITGDENWFCLSYESDYMFANAYIQFSIMSLLKTCSGSSLIGWREIELGG